jgi:hypothetical protein
VPLKLDCAFKAEMVAKKKVMIIAAFRIAVAFYVTTDVQGPANPTNK